MYLFKMFLHAWENHNDWHQSAKQQQEGESQPAHGGVVCWWAAWWQEAGGRAAQTGRLEKRRVRELAGPSCRNSGTGLWGFGIIRVMYAQLAGNKQKAKQTTQCALLEQPSFSFRQTNDLQPACDSSCHHSKALLFSDSYVALWAGSQRMPAWFTHRLLRGVWGTEAETGAELSHPSLNMNKHHSTQALSVNIAAVTGGIQFPWFGQAILPREQTFLTHASNLKEFKG